MSVVLTTQAINNIEKAMEFIPVADRDKALPHIQAALVLINKLGEVPANLDKKVTDLTKRLEESPNHQKAIEKVNEDLCSRNAELVNESENLKNQNALQAEKIFELTKKVNDNASKIGARDYQKETSYHYCVWALRRELFHLFEQIEWLGWSLEDLQKQSLLTRFKMRPLKIFDIHFFDPPHATAYELMIAIKQFDRIILTSRKCALCVMREAQVYAYNHRKVFSELDNEAWSQVLEYVKPIPEEAKKVFYTMFPTASEKRVSEMLYKIVWKYSENR